MSTWISPSTSGTSTSECVAEGKETMKTHKFDAISFFSGVIITAIGVPFLIPRTPSGIVDAIWNLGSWVWPVVLLAIGAAVLVPVFLPKKNQDRHQSTLSD